MNPDKKDDGWILCASKSIPGKYYYFNVTNGEAVWSLPDAKRPVNRPQITEVSNNGQNYPEPQIPVESNENVQITPDSNTTLKDSPNCNISIINKQAKLPSFGQISFPNYVPLKLDTPSTSHASIFDVSSNICTFKSTMPMFGQTKIVWAPIPLMMMEPKPQQTLDQITQTCDLEKDLFVHTCQIPLSKRFGNYENKKNTKEDKNEQTSAPVFTSTPIKQSPILPTVGQIVEPTIERKPILRDAILNINKKTDIEPKSFPTGVDRATEVLPKSFDQKIIEKNKNNNEDITLAGLKLCDSDNESDSKGDEEGKKCVKLQRDDLRLFLMARKRRHTEGEPDPTSKEMKRVKLKYRDDQEPLPKKRVTFNLNDELKSPDTSQEIYKDMNVKHSLESLKKLAGCHIKSEWYIVVDTNILLQDYEFVNNFVQSDENCRLLIPEETRREVESLCSGDSFGNRHVFTARQIVRMLRNPPLHVVNGTQTNSKSLGFFSDTNKVTKDAILNCCLQKMSQKHHVVLLTNNEDLLKKATLLHIHSFKFQTIKESDNFTGLDTTASKSQPSAPRNKEAFTRTQRMMQNIPDLESTRTNKNSIFDNDSVVTETSSDIGRVIHNINLKNSNDVIRTNEEAVHKFDIPSDLNSNKNDKNNSFLFQKLSRGSLKSFQIPNSNSSLFQVPNSNSNLFEYQTNKGLEKKRQFQIQNLKINNEPVPQTNQNANFIPLNSNKQFYIDNSTNAMELSVEDDLRSFNIRHNVMENRIKERIEEWICIFIQIMEDALSNVLQNSSFRSDLILPWSITEMINKVSELYEDIKIKIINRKLLSSMSECVCEKGKVRNSIKPQEFVRTVGCGVLLVQALKNIQQDCEELSNAMRSLTNLLRTIEDPSEVEFVENISRGNHIDNDREKRQNYVKKPLDIINYLKRHYDDWKDYDVSEENNTKKISLASTHDDTKVFRISGRNLNTLRIDNNKAITVVKNENADAKTNIENNVLNKVAAKLTIHKNKIESKEIVNTSKSPKKKIIFNENDAHKNVLLLNNENKKEVVDSTSNDKNAEPKMTRRISIIKEYEEKFIRSPLDMDLLDYSDFESDYGKNNQNIKTNTKENEINSTGHNDSGFSNSNNIIVIKETVKLRADSRKNINDSGKTKPVINNSGETKPVIASGKSKPVVNDFGMNKVDSTTGKDYISISDSKSDSGIENESCITYSFVKTFLGELSSTFKAVHNFIDENLDDVRKDQNVEDKSIILHTKVNDIRLHMGVIIEKLKSIVQREAHETGLSNLMLQIETAATDKRITRYRSIIRKCLEQAQNLQNALKIMLSLTDSDFDGSLSIPADSTSSSIRYLNIFE